MKSRIHLIERIPNRDRRFGSAEHYFPVLIRSSWDDEDEFALFTEGEIEQALTRGKNNPEDRPLEWWEKLAKWIWGEK